MQAQTPWEKEDTAQSCERAREAKLQGKHEVGGVSATATSNLRTLAGMAMCRLGCPSAKRDYPRTVHARITLNQ